MTKKKKSKRGVKAKPLKKKLIAPPYKKPKTSETKFLMIILAVLVILFLVSTFYNRYKLNLEAEKIINPLVVGKEIDEQALNKFMNTDYNELKEELGITKDFIVHFEDKDGNPIQINGMYGFGYKQST